jgi:hypothetical protein
MVLLRAVGDMPKSAAATRKLRNLATAIAASNSIKPHLLIILKIRMGNMPLCAPYWFNLALLSLMKRRKRMDLSLKGRRALVTGSSSGLGEGIVKMLA